MNPPASKVLEMSLLCAGLATAERPRELGISFPGVTGPLNAITDVAGVTVGHATVLVNDAQGKAVARTGVTAILPRGATFGPVFAGSHALNGNGELTGIHWLHESGFLEGPVVISNTNAIGAVHEGTLRWMRDTAYHGPEGLFALPVVGETWDGFLNDIDGFQVHPEHAAAALSGARGGPIREGNVGGGTGMVCFKFKGGIGTSSRTFAIDGNAYTLGVLVQANFGRRRDFTLRGVPIGALLIEDEAPLPEVEEEPAGRAGAGSIIAVVATDVPLLPHQLNRIAQRVGLGVGRTGGVATNTSGDIFVAFSTANAGVWSAPGTYEATAISNDAIDVVFDATIEATEEAIVNALFAGETLTGYHDHTVHALPKQRVLDLMHQSARSIPSLRP